MSERDFWDIVRRALYMVIRAIERRYQLPGVTIVEISERAEVTFAR